ncbi:hypothetical protein CAP36_13725 [Chitinophagaceae bacterium IBVUCB2]|nr:hypothetical protein CAP36_13725 [Chitinophagaceae bacterium IBVUCB2]
MRIPILIIFLLASKISYSQNPKLASLQVELVRLFSIGQLKEANIYADSVRKIILSTQQKSDTIYPYLLYYSAMANGLLKRYDESEKLIEELELVVLKRYGASDIKYYSALNIHYLIYHRKNNYFKTTPFLEKCREILLKNIDKLAKGGVVNTFEATYNIEDVRFLMSSCLSDLGFGYIHTNRYLEGLELIKKSDTYYNAEYAKKYDPQSHITYMTNFGSFFMHIEDIKRADSIYINLEEWAKEYYGANHPTYGKVLYYQASFYYTIGESKKAEKYFLLAKKNLETTFQKKSDHYLTTLVLLGNIYISSEDLTNLKIIISSVKKIIPDIKKENIVEFTQIRTLLIQFHLLVNEKKSADSLMLELDEAFNKKNFSFSFSYSTYLHYKSLLLTLNENYSKADSVYKLLIANAEKNNSTLTKKYSDYLLNRAMNLKKWGKVSEGESVLKKSIDVVEETLKKNFNFLSDNQKQSYLIYSNRYFNELNKQIIISDNKSLKETAYNMQLLLKGLLLKTAIITNRKNSNPAYQQLLKKYNVIRNTIVYQYSKSGDSKENINLLTEQAEKIEKELTKLSPNFVAQQFKTPTINDIISKLEKTEAAIEFFSYNVRDTVFYCAILLKNKIAEPITVPLFNNRDFDYIITKTRTEKKETTINFRYSKSTQLYELIWHPLEAHLSGISTIYFSATGILHKIPVAALTMKDNKILSDKYKFFQLNTTGSVSNYEQDYVRISDKLNLYGGIFYDGDTTALKQAAIKYTSSYIVSRSFPNDLERGNIYQYLPDSKLEVENISQMASDKNYIVTSYIGWEATEESLKSISGRNSPEVLHIATHGFFFPDPKGKLENSVATEGRIFKQSDDPLMRSGLTMAGANYAWDNKSISGIQDGILTAYEVANLNLSNTKLAVLSACETGLGDIQGSEGVYGLQRAFKIAGAKNLIMSLWDVPDAETAEFMTEFYRKLFTGNTIDDAFRNTQTTMKNKYRNEPYKWAAWILVR